jgi:hypothetical protein
MNMTRWANAHPRAMKVIAFGVVILALAVFAVSHEYEPARPGSATVYAEIETSTDCVWLQETFDRAYANHGRASYGSGEREWTRGYMHASDDRMREIGCFG